MLRPVRRRSFAARALLLAAALTAGGCGSLRDDARDTTRHFWEALAAEDYAGAAALTDGASREAVAQLAASHRIERFTLGEPLANAEAAQVPVHVQREAGAGPGFSFHTHLSRSGGVWRVDLRLTRRDLARELLASSFEGVKEALRESGEAFVEEFEMRALEASEALRQTLEELDEMLSRPQAPGEPPRAP